MEPDIRRVGRDVRRRRDDMFREAHAQPLRTLEEREMEANEWLPLEDIPSQDDRDYVNKYDWGKNEAAWEQYETDEWVQGENGMEKKKDWRLIDEEVRKQFKEKSDRINAYDGKLNWIRTRIPPQEYNKRKNEIEKHGIGKVYIRPQKTGKLHSLSVWFPENFEHLTNVVGQTEKYNEESGYHISLAYDGMPDWLEAQLNQFKKEFFTEYEDAPGYYDWLEKVFDKEGDMRVSSGSTYEFRNMDDPFVAWVNYLQKHGAGKKNSWAHVSLD